MASDNIIIRPTLSFRLFLFLRDTFCIEGIAQIPINCRSKEI